MWHKVINLFFPKVCSGCNSLLLSEEKTICTICRHNLPLTNQHLDPENIYFKKFYGRVSLNHVSALLFFYKKGIVQQLIHNLKYKGHQEIGTVLGNWYAEDLKEVEALQNIDAIVPVPLHYKKFKERGYNQLSYFGQSLSENLKVSYNPNLLKRVLYSESQTKKNLKKRNENTNTVFDVVFTENDHNKHYLLIDDVLTTGATLTACAKALLKIPGTKISVVCIAATG